MYITWLKLCRHFSDRPDEYWENAIYLQNCRRSVCTHHGSIMCKAKELFSILSQNECDGKVMKKGSETALSHHPFKRYRLKIKWNAIHLLRRKGFVTSQEKLDLCGKYHEQAYDVSYTCSERYFAVGNRQWWSRHHSKGMNV